jgi:Chalcone isomerase-like
MRRARSHEWVGTTDTTRASIFVPVAAALAVCLAGPARGLEIEGVRFPAEIRAHGVSLTLNNAALLRYRIFIKAYVAALYLGEEMQPADVLSDVPKRLEIEYFWAISAPDFGVATNRGIAANVDAATLAGLRPRIDRMNALYRDVKPGDRYALTYLPGLGTELSLNGKPLGTIEGSDFASALFSIWLGKNALDGSLRDRLLARR